ncbi:hypothetical protein K438DRAFT_1787288 [Mycena galopus ATCC 62051]|nr:hypothetical protein K438DRAFT_1787288 [Mycena galopus ATCC 62051]
MVAVQLHMDMERSWHRRRMFIVDLMLTWEEATPREKAMVDAEGSIPPPHAFRIGKYVCIANEMNKTVARINKEIEIHIKMHSTRLLVWVQREKSKWESRGRTTGGRHSTAFGSTSLLLGSWAIAEDNDVVVVVVEGATFALAVGFRRRQRGVTLCDGEEGGDGSNVMRDLYSSSCESVGDGGRGVRRARVSI